MIDILIFSPYIPPAANAERNRHAVHSRHKASDTRYTPETTRKDYVSVYRQTNTRVVVVTMVVTMIVVAVTMIVTTLVVATMIVAAATMLVHGSSKFRE